MALPFDRVALNSDAGIAQLSVEQFCRLPLTERLRAVLERRVEFFCGSERVEPLDALRALRESAA